MFSFLVNYIAIKIELRKSRVKMISMFPGPSVTNINCFYLALKTFFFEGGAERSLCKVKRIKEKLVSLFCNSLFSG